MKAILPTLGLVLLLAGCAGTQRVGEVAYYDLLVPSRPFAPLKSLRALDVVAPSWLDSGALQYRLMYEDSGRRLAYSRSRWAASPAEMLEQALKRSLQGDSTAGRCRLRLELVEFQQTFDSPLASRAVLAARASLYADEGKGILARQSFNLVRPADTADGPGGVKALSALAGDLEEGLRTWLQGDLGRQCQ